MITALKTASGAYLETSVSTAEIVFPFPVIGEFLNELRSACSLLSLDMPLSVQPPAGTLATRAHGVVRRCGTAVTDQLPQAVSEDDSA